MAEYRFIKAPPIEAMPQKHAAKVCEMLVLLHESMEDKEYIADVVQQTGVTEEWVMETLEVQRNAYTIYLNLLRDIYGGNDEQS